MSNISKIKISGTSYSIKDENACKVVELTQAQYDDLPTSAKTSNSLFVITDAEAGDLSNYYTKTEADGLLDTKLDVTAYTPTDLSNYYTKSETSGATEISTALESKADTATTYTKTETDNAITAATSTKQDTLVSGTNIKTINGETLLGEGNITIQGGSGGGKAIEAGRGISITTGETADTVSFNLPIYRDNRSGSGSSVKIGANNGNLNGPYSLVVGEQNTLSSNDSIAVGRNCITYYGSQNFVGGYNSVVGQNSSNNSDYCIAFGNNVKATYFSEAAFGRYNVSRRNTSQSSASTIFSVGNGSIQSRHNAFEIRLNGDIYIADTNDTSTTNYYEKPMIKLQDALGGGGGSTYTAGDGIDISNDVISVTGKVDTSAITTSVTSSSTDSQVPSAKAVNDKLGGLSIVKLTESEYTALVTKDSDTLYVVVPDPSN